MPWFPFGSDFTPVERWLIGALEIMQDAQHKPLRLANLLWQGLLLTPTGGEDLCLARLGLDKPTTITERAYRALVGAALRMVAPLSRPT